MSMSKKQKLELTWIGKENRPRLEPRILLEDPARSYHAPHRVSKDDLFDNKLIFGDNLKHQNDGQKGRQPRMNANKREWRPRNIVSNSCSLAFIRG